MYTFAREGGLQSRKTGSGLRKALLAQLTYSTSADLLLRFTTVSCDRVLSRKEGDRTHPQRSHSAQMPRFHPCPDIASPVSPLPTRSSVGSFFGSESDEGLDGFGTEGQVGYFIKSR